MGSADFILHSTYLHNFRPEGLPPPPWALIGKLGLAWGVALGARFLPGSRGAVFYEGLAAAMEEGNFTRYIAGFR